jgi:phage gpG-like protein
MITVDIENKREVNLFFMGVENIRKTSQLKKLSTAVGHSFRKEWKENFKREGSETYQAGFKKWRPLKKTTKYSKGRLGFGSKSILERTGKLGRSIFKKGSQGNIDRHRGGSAVFGTSIPYAIYHQSRNPRTKLPRRRMIGVSRPQLRKMGRMAGYLVYRNAEGNSVSWRTIYNFGRRVA